MQQPVAIVVADSARARLFTFKREDDRGAAPVLRERADLVSPERRMRAGDVFSETRPSLANNPSGHGNTIDDHRNAHVDETDRRFAHQVIERAAALCSETACTRVALVAGPRFLGHLREHLPMLRGVPVDEVARDLTHEAAPKLRDHLASLGVIPAAPPR
ncbi:MAG TPA: host attachment protein [Kofleriaceae bacterium]|nr:host attachment protein [Kofleriaceae bacterium]